MKRTLIVALLVTLSFAGNAFAVGEARVTGTVTDSSGDPIPNVEITVTATEKMTFEKGFKANDKGDYAIFLLDGTVRYEFAFSKDGYVTHKEVWKLDLVPSKNVKDVVLKKPSEVEGASTVVTREAAANPAYTTYNEGVALANEGNDEGAIAKFREAVTLDPELSAGWTALAKIAARAEDWKTVVEAGETALELAGEDPVIASLLADAYTALGDKEKAKSYRKMAPANPAVLFNEAVPHLNANRDDEAEKLLLQAVAVDDTFAKAHYELGSIYARQGKSEPAKKHLMRYLELEPSGENAAFAREMIKYLE